MALIEWTDAFSVKVNAIDEQHKKLVGYLNELYDALEQKEEQKILTRLFNNLDKYAQVHFSFEEKYFEKFSYDKKDIHFSQHQWFVNELKRMKKQISSGTMDAEDLLGFLVNWLVNHIKGSDHEYTGCFNEHGLR